MRLIFNVFDGFLAGAYFDVRRRSEVENNNVNAIHNAILTEVKALK